jgi:hypothetical protein
MLADFCSSACGQIYDDVKDVIDAVDTNLVEEDDAFISLSSHGMSLVYLHGLLDVLENTEPPSTPYELVRPIERLVNSSATQHIGHLPG